MAKRVVVISYDDQFEGGVARKQLLDVVDTLRPLFEDVQPFEVHATRGSTAAHILNVLADQIPKGVKQQRPEVATAVGKEIAAQLNEGGAREHISGPGQRRSG